MNTHLHFIVGSTTTGKTDLAISMAQENKAPVISVDRVQCFDELSIGSGRPSKAELKFTQRIYITNQKVEDGELPAAVANEMLHDLISEMSKKHPLIIMEGGSISLLKEISCDTRWRAYEQTYEKVHMSKPADYLKKARNRVLNMIAPKEWPGSILQELASLWKNPKTHSVLRGISGYKTIIHYAEFFKIPIEELPDLTLPVIVDLAEEVAYEYFQYATEQQHEISKLSFFQTPLKEA